MEAQKWVRRQIEGLSDVKPRYGTRTPKRKDRSNKSFKTALNNNPDNEYDIILEMEFETMEDLAIYVEHPEHKRIVEILKSIRELKASIDYIM